MHAVRRVLAAFKNKYKRKFGANGLVFVSKLSGASAYTATSKGT